MGELLNSRMKVKHKETKNKIEKCRFFSGYGVVSQLPLPLSDDLCSGSRKPQGSTPKGPPAAVLQAWFKPLSQPPLTWYRSQTLRDILDPSPSLTPTHPAISGPAGSPS